MSIDSELEKEREEQTKNQTNHKPRKKPSSKLITIDEIPLGLCARYTNRELYYRGQIETYELV